MLKKTLLGLSILTSFASAGFAQTSTPPAAPATPPPAVQTSPSKIEDIKKLLSLTQATKMSELAVKQMLEMLKKQIPDSKPEVFEEIAKEININDLVNKMVVIYDKNLGAEEIKALIKFYETPEGQKFLAAMPKIMEESMKAGQEWGMSLGPKIMQRLQEKGLIPKNPVMPPRPETAPGQNK